MRPNASEPNPGRTYRFYTGTPVYPYGFGMSYTTFTYQWYTLQDGSTIAIAEEDIPEVRAGTSLFDPRFTGVLTTVSVNVTNTGKVSGDDVVMYFVIPPNAGQNGTPLQYLAGFERITLYPGQSQVVSFDVTQQSLRMADADAFYRTKAGEFEIQIGDLRKSVIVK